MENHLPLMPETPTAADLLRLGSIHSESARLMVAAVQEHETALSTPTDVDNVLLRLLVSATYAPPLLVALDRFVSRKAGAGTLDVAWRGLGEPNHAADLLSSRLQEAANATRDFEGWVHRARIITTHLRLREAS